MLSNKPSGLLSPNASKNAGRMGGRALALMAAGAVLVGGTGYGLYRYRTAQSAPAATAPASAAAPAASEPAAPVPPPSSPKAAIPAAVPLPAPAAPAADTPETTPAPPATPSFWDGQAEPADPARYAAEAARLLQGLDLPAWLKQKLLDPEFMRQAVLDVDAIADGQQPRLAGAERSANHLRFSVRLAQEVASLPEVDEAKLSYWRHRFPGDRLPETAEAYRRLEPLLEGFYREEKPEGGFRHRVKKALDLLAETPEISTPPLLFSQRGRYVFKNPELEAWPPVRKLLLRSGTKTAAQVAGDMARLRDAMGTATMPEKAGGTP